MADRRISLRLAVRGLRESVRALVAFGDAGAAALGTIVAKAGGGDRGLSGG